MATTDQEYIDRMVNNAIENQRSKYMEASSELNVWHCPSMSKENFWRLLSATAQAIMAQRGVYHSFVIDDNNALSYSWEPAINLSGGGSSSGGGNYVECDLSCPGLEWACIPCD